MRKTGLFAITLGIVLSLTGVAVVVAHEGEGEEMIAVEPPSVAAGETCVLVGSGLEPDSERVLVLAGEDLVVEFGTVRADAEGMFETELTIPSHLPAGTYELRAIGDETLAVPLAITTASGAQATPAANPAEETIAARGRSPIELALILAFVALAAVVGGLLVWRAERFRGAAA